MQLVKLEEQAKQLKLSAITISESLRYGMFRSLFVGQGIDFDSCREYELNDDVRYIDWNLTARTGRAFVKLYSEEHDVTVFVVVDASDSMTAISAGAKSETSYFDKAVELASLFLFAGFHLTCQIGGVVFSDKVQKLWLPKQGSDFVFSVVHEMQKISIKEGAKSNLNAALKLSNKILTRHSLVILISDFKINDYEKRLSLLSKNHDVIAIKIYSKNDYEFPSVGLLKVYDSENEQSLFINSSSKKTQQLYEKNFSKNIITWENKCVDMGVLPFKISTDGHSVKEVSNFLMSAKNKYEAISIFKKNRQR